MLIVGIVMIVISILIIFTTTKEKNRIHEINKQIDEENTILDNKNKELKINNSNLLNQFATLKQKTEREEDRLSNLREAATAALDAQKDLSQKAFENYCEILEKQYTEAEQEQNECIDNLKEAYSKLQLELMREADEARKDLDEIQATRAAAIQAQLKEKEIKEKLSFYCLKINQTDLDDIKVLERMKAQLHNPRILSMLVWKSYFQKPMTTLCNNILGTSTVCGIYKITNQLDNMCYIGQSVDVDKRFKDHAKCGLSIDTPPGNKLYKAMIEDGLWNFSFELLEECPREQLNQKERYYINLYQADKFGYNILSGNNT